MTAQFEWYQVVLLVMLRVGVLIAVVEDALTLEAVGVACGRSHRPGVSADADGGLDVLLSHPLVDHSRRAAWVGKHLVDKHAAGGMRDWEARRPGSSQGQRKAE